MKEFVFCIVASAMLASSIAASADTVVAGPSDVTLGQVPSNYSAAEALGRGILSYKPNEDDVSLRRCSAGVEVVTCDVWYKNALSEPVYLHAGPVRFVLDAQGQWTAERVND